MSPDIQAYVRDVVSDVKTVVTQDDHAVSTIQQVILMMIISLIGVTLSCMNLQVIAPLMEFLMSNLQTFASHLFPDVLQM